MLEDDTTFGVAYRALIAFERSLSVRQRVYVSVKRVFKLEVRVRFQKDHALAQHAARVLSKAHLGDKLARLARASS